MEAARRPSMAKLWPRTSAIVCGCLNYLSRVRLPKFVVDNVTSAWSHLLERSNDPKMPAAGQYHLNWTTCTMTIADKARTILYDYQYIEKPEIFKAPGGPNGAWGAGGSAWGARPGNQTTISDGQQFTVALSKALHQHKQAEKRP